MKKYLKYLWTLPILFGVAMYGTTASTDLFTITGRGASWGQDIFRINTDLRLILNDSSGSEVLGINTDGDVVPGGNIVVGSESVAIATTNTSGLSQGTVVQAVVLDGWLGRAVSEGMVLIATGVVTSANSSLTVNASSGSEVRNWFGIAGADISTGATGSCYISGIVLALTTGTVNSGDLLVTTVSAVGYLAKATADTNSGSVVGVALGNGTSTGGLTKIRIR